MAVVRRPPALIALLLLGGCTASSGGTAAEASSSSATLPCRDSIDGSAPPDGFQVVLGAVALPTSPTGPALQAADSGGPDGPRLFADPPGNRVGIAWGNPGPGPSRRFVVPACADAYGSGWLACPGRQPPAGNG
jgi:hypothetical protein